MTREAIEAAIYDAPLGIPPKFKPRTDDLEPIDNSDDWKGERLIRIATGTGKKDDKNGARGQTLMQGRSLATMSYRSP